MQTDLEKAKHLLTEGTYTCVLCKQESVYTAHERGVKPLLGFLEAGVNLHGFAAADKVVGKAAALLYVLLGVKEIYAPVMSKSAAGVFPAYGIAFFCDRLVANIRNRANTGFCPMEEAVACTDTPEDALVAIKAKAAQLAAGCPTAELKAK